MTQVRQSQAGRLQHQGYQAVFTCRSMLKFKLLQTLGLPVGAAGAFCKSDAWTISTCIGASV